MDEERVVAAAIKFYPINRISPSIMTGHRHSYIFEDMFSLGIKYDKQSHVQGFWTSQDRFVDRHEAFNIAFNAGQIFSSVLEEYSEQYGCLDGIPLFSEDVW